MFENMLPIGSVVLLKNAVKKTMIIGYKQVSASDPGKIYDYAGIMYPYGSMGAATQFVFNHKDIQDIIFRGYTNSEWDEMIEALENEVNENPELKEIIGRGSEN